VTAGSALEGLLHEVAGALAPRTLVRFRGEDPVLPTRYRVGEAAAAALGACAAAAADLHRLRTGCSQQVSVEVPRAAASLLSFALQRLEGEETLRPALTNPTVALYRAKDGRWIHLHGGFPNLREGTLRVLGCPDDADHIARAVAARDGQALEDALAEAGQCGALVRSPSEWDSHAQGKALAALPVVEVRKLGEAAPEPLRAGTRPLEGVRVLDLTRVLAGPTCARTLAEHGAEVLKINAPHLPFVPPFVIDTGHGKRSAHLDLRDGADRERLRDLARQADVFSQGYRQGALARHGFSPEALAELRPGIVYVSMNCYGPIGPFAERPGWEQLAQSATGIAATHGTMERPRLLPAAATDYTTGYLAAFGAMLALHRRATEGGSWLVRASLSQTGMWIRRLGRLDEGAEHAPGVSLESCAPWMLESETKFGKLRHLGPVAELSLTPLAFAFPTVPLGTHAPRWTSREDSQTGD
jgi:crotonobetainyl-CoA:carnitine CoA-transferase CaiB-like acyl-CoA transferase